MNLQLSLKTKWFEMTKAGIKTEDYREINEYWYNRLVNNGTFDFQKTKIYSFKLFTKNTMTLGCPKSSDTERIIKYEHKGIEIRTGNPEWGAEPNKLYFVILHGAILESIEK